MRTWTKLLAAGAGLALAACGMKATDQAKDMPINSLRVSALLTVPPAATGQPILLEYCLEPTPAITNPADAGFPCGVGVSPLKADMYWSAASGLYSERVKALKKRNYWFRASGGTAPDDYESEWQRVLDGDLGGTLILMLNPKNPPGFENWAPRICALVANRQCVGPGETIELRACWEDKDGDTSSKSPPTPETITWSWTALMPTGLPCGFFDTSNSSVTGETSGAIAARWTATEACFGSVSNPNPDGEVTIGIKLDDGNRGGKYGFGHRFKVGRDCLGYTEDVLACVNQWPSIDYIEAQNLSGTGEPPLPAPYANIERGESTQITAVKLVPPVDPDLDPVVYEWSTGSFVPSAPEGRTCMGFLDGTAGGLDAYLACCDADETCCGWFADMATGEPLLRPPASNAEIVRLQATKPVDGYCRVNLIVRDLFQQGDPCLGTAEPNSPKGGVTQNYLHVHVGPTQFLMAPQVVDATPVQSPISDCAGQPIHFAISGFNPNADPEPISYRWFVDGTEALLDAGQPLVGGVSTSTFSYTFPAAATYAVSVEMCADTGLSAGVVCAPTFPWDVVVGACP